MTLSELQVTANTIYIKGEITFNTVKTLWQQSKKKFPQSPDITIDLSQVTHSDSSGLALLIEWLRLAQTKQQKLKFNNLPPQLKNIAKLAKFTNILNLTGTINDTTT